MAPSRRGQPEPRPASAVSLRTRSIGHWNGLKHMGRVNLGSRVQGER